MMAKFKKKHLFWAVIMYFKLKKINLYAVFIRSFLGKRATEFYEHDKQYIIAKSSHFT